MAKSNLAYDEQRYNYNRLSYGHNMNYATEAERERYSNLRIRPAQQITVEKARKQTSKTRVKPKKKSAINVLLVVLAIAAFFVLCRGVMITEKFEDVEAKRGLLKEMQTTNQKTQIEIDSALNLKNVEDVAQNRLNMGRPEKHQTVYIKIAQDDVVEKTDHSSPVEAVGDFFGSIKAYLD